MLLRVLSTALLSAVPAAPPAVVSSAFIDGEGTHPSCHASTIVETAPGRLAAAWFGGTKEGAPDVAIWVALFEDGRWGAPAKVADGASPDGKTWPTWNPVLFQPRDGPLHLFYKVGPNPREWWGMLRTSGDGGRRWSAARRLPDGVLGPIKNKPIVLADGTWLSPSSTEAEASDWRLRFERSSDGGRTWEIIGPVDRGPGFQAIQPSVLVHPDGQLQAVCRTRQGVNAMTWSKDGGKTWSPLAATELPNPNSGADAVTLADGRHLIVYNPSAHAPETPGKGPRWPLAVAVSRDGLRWTNVLTLEDEPCPAGYAYPAVIQASDGRVHVTYTWDRRHIKHVVLDPSRL